jgi:hypothetical protein
VRHLARDGAVPGTFMGEGLGTFECFDVDLGTVFQGPFTPAHDFFSDALSAPHFFGKVFKLKGLISLRKAYMISIDYVSNTDLLRGL